MSRRRERTGKGVSGEMDILLFSGFRRSDGGDKGRRGNILLRAIFPNSGLGLVVREKIFEDFQQLQELSVHIDSLGIHIFLILEGLKSRRH